MIDSLRFGTRGSALALWQTRHVMSQLQTVHPALHLEYEVIKTRGDVLLDMPLPLIDGKGVFTAELEAALHDKRIDCAVHCLKDLPTTLPESLVIGAILARANPADALISRDGYTLVTLPHGAKVGTSSVRRAAQLLHHRPDLQILDIRGNIDTRIRKALDPNGEFDAIVLAHAGLERLEQTTVISEVLDFNIMLPAPGQGAIAVQTRDDPMLLSTLERIHHLPSALAVTAERAFLAGLGGGCAVPVAAYASWEQHQLILHGRVITPDGTHQTEVTASEAVTDLSAAQMLGIRLAQMAIEQGAHLE